MMAAERSRAAPRLAERLPPLRGRVSEAAPLGRLTWFRVGGPAEVLVRPADREDLIALLAGRPAEVPVTVIGVASNLLVRDGGVPGVVLRLARGFADIVPQAGGRVVAGAGALDINVARTAQAAGLGGLEFLCGVPGTVGGALRMNAGAYGREMKDVLLWAEAVDPHGEVHRLAPADLGHAYRHSAVPEDWIFLAACLQGEAAAPETVAERMREVRQAREASQPIRTRTGGSTFKNPPGEKAWRLIEAAGCRGLKLGGAQVSEKHCNFLVNTGAATAADLEALGEEVRRRVRAASGVELEWEIRRIGVPAAGGAP